MKYENTFKAIDQILWKEQGCGSELDYLEQKSWMLFLKYLDDLETEREDEAELEGKIIVGEFANKPHAELTDNIKALAEENSDKPLAIKSAFEELD